MNYKRYSKREKGFTLIELLVVIAIVSLIASVVLAGMGTARAKARDARRISDIKAVVNALELYRADNNGAYPATPTAGTACSDGTAAPYNCIGNVTELVTGRYLPSLPADPSWPGTGSNYRYGSNSTGYQIIIRTQNINPTSWCRPQITTPNSTYGNWGTSYPEC